MLLLLINLTMYVEENRTSIMDLIIKSSSGTSMSAIESLVSFFYKCMDMAKYVFVLKLLRVVLLYWRLYFAVLLNKIPTKFLTTQLLKRTMKWMRP